MLGLEIDDGFRISAGFGASVYRCDDHAIAVVVEESCGEREAPAHVLERVVPHHIESLQSETGGDGSLLLASNHPVNALVENVQLFAGPTDCAQKIELAAFTSQDQVLAPHLSQTDRDPDAYEESNKSNARHDGERKGLLRGSEFRHGGASYTGTMRANEIEELLLAVRDGDITVDSALNALRDLPYSDLGFARLDTHRELRQGLPEAIYAEGKTTEQVLAIADRLLTTTTGPVLATRTSDEQARLLVDRFPEAVHHSSARLVVVRSEPTRHVEGSVVVVAAGTSDLPVADEAAFTAEALGAKVERLNDVGVAGLHRLMAVRPALEAADVVIVVAGMEGALPSIVGGITGAPVVAVPTSVGYGSSFEGLAALLTMLNSCSAGVTVTNIDNGFGAGVFALRLLGPR